MIPTHHCTVPNRHTQKHELMRVFSLSRILAHSCCVWFEFLIKLAPVVLEEVEEDTCGSSSSSAPPPPAELAELRACTRQTSVKIRQKRPMNVKKDPWTWKETCEYQMTSVQDTCCHSNELRHGRLVWKYVKRDLRMWKETYECGKSCECEKSP